MNLMNLILQGNARTARRGFTVHELVAVITSTSLVGLSVLPTLTPPQEKVRRSVCASNLRAIASAYVTWAREHEYGGRHSFPFRMPPRELAPGLYDPDYGTQAVPGIEEAWFHFAWISNELSSPRLLVCPSDETKQAATDFGGDSAGGFAHPTQQNNSLSYAIFLDATYLGSGRGLAYEESPRHFLSSDRHLHVTARSGQACSSGVRSAAAIRVRPTVDPNVGWTNAVHGPVVGNVVTVDTSVAAVRKAQLHAMLPFADGGGSIHLLLPP